MRLILKSGAEGVLRPPLTLYFQLFFALGLLDLHFCSTTRK